MTEQIFLNLPEKGVKITNTRFMVPGETYAMSGIVSVKTTTNSTSSTSKESTSSCIVYFFKAIALILGIIISAIFSKIMFWIVSCFEGVWHFLLSLIAYGIDGFLIVFLAAMTFYTEPSNTKEGSTSKESIVKVDNYTITLRTASGEVKALESTDSDFVSQVTQALNQAIIARG